MAATKDKPIRAKRHVVKLAEIAYRELGLSGTFNTRADEERLERLWRGMQFLDNQLSDWKAKLDDLIEQYAVTKDAKLLMAGLLILNTAVNEEAEREYEAEVEEMRWEDAMDLVSDKLEDVEDFDEPKFTRLVELLLDKPVRLTTPNPRKTREPMR